MTPEPHSAGDPAPPPSIAPYYPPGYPPPPPARPLAPRSDGRAIAALVCGIFGLLLVLAGVPALILGPLAYFLGRSAQRRIEESKGALGGHGAAFAAWLIGVITTALGAAVTLVWFVILLLQVSGPGY